MTTVTLSSRDIPEHWRTGAFCFRRDLPDHVSRFIHEVLLTVRAWTHKLPHGRRDLGFHHDLETQSLVEADSLLSALKPPIGLSGSHYLGEHLRSNSSASRFFANDHRADEEDIGAAHLLELDRANQLSALPGCPDLTIDPAGIPSGLAVQSKYRVIVSLRRE